MKPTKFTYLAQPYAHPEPGVRADRAELGAIAAAWLMQRNYAVHAPIPQGRVVAMHLPPACIDDHDFWLPRDLEILHRAQCLHVLPLEGWRRSRGLLEELSSAACQRKPIYIIQTLPGGFSNRLEKISHDEAQLHGWRFEE